MRIVKSTYYSNWSDRVGYPLAGFFVKPLSKVSFVTPNMVTIAAFSIYIFGCISLLLNYPYHNIAAAFLIFFGFVGDDMDGQLARITKKYSTLGDYLDKVLDVFKIFVVTLCGGLAAYFATGNVIYIVLGFVICFGFSYRYYIKLETIFSMMSRDEKYLEKSALKRKELEEKMDILYSHKANSIKDAIKLSAIKNRTFLFFDEAEIAIVIGIGAALGYLGTALWIVAIAQVIIAAFRVFERGRQLTQNSDDLLKPMRK